MPEVAHNNLEIPKEWDNLRRQVEMLGETCTDVRGRFIGFTREAEPNDGADPLDGYSSECKTSFGEEIRIMATNIKALREVMQGFLSRLEI